MLLLLNNEEWKGLSLLMEAFLGLNNIMVVQ